jgi:hypothetical protein
MPERFRREPIDAAPRIDKDDGFEGNDYGEENRKHPCQSDE